MNAITVIYKRNPENDQTENDIVYKGYDILWENYEPANTKIAKFCQVGTRTILGENPSDLILVTMYFIVREDQHAPKPKLPPGLKCRRMYILKENNVARFYFKNSMPTEMVYTSEDEQRVKDWVNFDTLAENEKQWFDFYATAQNIMQE